MDGWDEFDPKDIIDSDCLIKTVGFFVAENRHYIYLVQSKSIDEEGETVMSNMAILKKQITEVKEL